MLLSLSPGCEPPVICRGSDEHSAPPWLPGCGNGATADWQTCFRYHVGGPRHRLAVGLPRESGKGCCYGHLPPICGGGIQTSLFPEHTSVCLVAGHVPLACSRAQGGSLFIPGRTGAQGHSLMAGSGRSVLSTSVLSPVCVLLRREGGLRARTLRNGRRMRCVHYSCTLLQGEVTGGSVGVAVGRRAGP